MKSRNEHGFVIFIILLATQQLKLFVFVEIFWKLGKDFLHS